jgi:multiple sugar transport system substrate-binding protein
LGSGPAKPALCDHYDLQRSIDAKGGGHAVREDSFTRRGFLRVAAGAAAVATGAGCGSDKPKSSPSATRAGANGDRTLRIAQWNNYVAGYDPWWDNEYTKRWGERNGIEVVVDHFDINQQPAHAEAEVASQRGHDLFHIQITSPAPFEDHVIDHREIIDEVEAKVGKMPPFVERSVFNPRTKKYFGFSDFWIANPVHYRTDLWDRIGLRPDTWEDVLAAGPRLKAEGYPVGIGMGLDPESNLTLLALMHGFGASVQDEDANVVINNPATVEAVKLGAAIFRSAMTDDVLHWDITSNNRYLVSGRVSLILNSVAALRALETQDPTLAAKVALLPVPAGPAGRASPYAVGIYVIWKFAANQEAAKQFLVDLAIAAREPFLKSRFQDLPSFPGAVADLRDLAANDPESQPRDKYRLLSDAAGWASNSGHPGHTNAAIDEVIKASLITQMFAAAAREEMSAEDAVRAAEAQMTPIFEKWRQRGKI